MNSQTTSAYDFQRRIVDLAVDAQTRKKGICQSPITFIVHLQFLTETSKKAPCTQKKLNTYLLEVYIAVRNA